MRQLPSIGGSLELCYWAKSSGHNRLSRLSTEGLKRALISWLLCSVLRFLYLVALILTTSVTYGISKSQCKVWLETYQGALLIILSIFDWNVWRILVLDGLLHPHSSTPYVQMGRSIALYTVSLLSRDSCERAFIGQLMFLILSSSWLLCASSTLVAGYLRPEYRHTKNIRCLLLFHDKSSYAQAPNCYVIVHCLSS